MTAHAKVTVRRSCIAQVLDLPLAVPTTKAWLAIGLISRKDREVFNFVAASAAAVRAVIANEGAIAKEEQVRIRVEQGPAAVTTKAVKMPSVPSWKGEVSILLLPQIMGRMIK
jgi:hypothetical protein